MGIYYEPMATRKNYVLVGKGRRGGLTKSFEWARAVADSTLELIILVERVGLSQSKIVNIRRAGEYAQIPPVAYERLKLKDARLVTPEEIDLILERKAASCPATSTPSLSTQ